MSILRFNGVIGKDIMPTWIDDTNIHLWKLFSSRLLKTFKYEKFTSYCLYSILTWSGAPINLTYPYQLPLFSSPSAYLGKKNEIMGHQKPDSCKSLRWSGWDQKSYWCQDRWLRLWTLSSNFTMLKFKFFS